MSFIEELNAKKQRSGLWYSELGGLIATALAEARLAEAGLAEARLGPLYDAAS
jgi:hypothetical protein